MVSDGEKNKTCKDRVAVSLITSSSHPNNDAIKRCGVWLCGVVWCGVVWWGVVWYNVVWFGVV